jgi:hypothetical protein
MITEKLAKMDWINISLSQPDWPAWTPQKPWWPQLPIEQWIVEETTQW